MVRGYLAPVGCTAAVIHALGGATVAISSVDGEPHVRGANRIAQPDGGWMNMDEQTG